MRIANCCYTYFFNCFSRVFYVMAMKNYLNIFLCAPCETLFVYFSCVFFFYSVNSANVCFLIKRTKCAAEKKEEKKKPKNNINLIKNFSTFIFREVIDNGFRAVRGKGSCHKKTNKSQPTSWVYYVYYSIFISMRTISLVSVTNSISKTSCFCCYICTYTYKYRLQLINIIVN